MRLYIKSLSFDCQMTDFLCINVLYACLTITTAIFPRLILP